jgi:drug/metabolite transporter (DMT)-like permease
MVALTITFTSLGQIIVKWQVNKATPPSGSLVDYLLWGLTMAINPWIVLVFMLGACAAFCWFFAMSRLPLNLAYPFIGLTFPTVAVAASVAFGEPINFWHMAGIFMIVGGLAVIGWAGVVR